MLFGKKIINKILQIYLYHYHLNKTQNISTTSKVYAVAILLPFFSHLKLRSDTLGLINFQPSNLNNGLFL
tara:strand:- start:245 stop:454 length:210 start_codon:yes stop_codon:yes gene_type:complete